MIAADTVTVAGVRGLSVWDADTDALSRVMIMSERLD